MPQLYFRLFFIRPRKKCCTSCVPGAIIKFPTWISSEALGFYSIVCSWQYGIDWLVQMLCQEQTTKSILDDSSNGICASKGVVLDKLNSLAAKPRTTRTRQAAVLLTDGTSTPFSPAPPMPVSGAC